MPIKPTIKKPRAFISPLLSKKTVEEERFLSFKKTITEYIDRVKREYASKQSEPNIVTNALKPLFEELGYRSGAYSQNGLSGADLILKNSDEKPGVIIEAKKEGSREFINGDSLNKRALHEAILYFLRERDSGNSSLFHIIITDFYQFYVFDAKDFDRLFWKNRQIKKLYTNYKDPSILGDGTSSFYEEVERELERTKADLIDDLEIECAYFNLKEYESLDEKKSIALYKLLSSDTLLKEFNPNDANSLNRQFYSELLHILGLEEVKESGKKRIKRSKLKEEGSFYENILDKLITHGKLDPKADEELKLDSVLSLLVIWLNRILFLKLVESQVIIWSDGESKKFLNRKKVAGYNELENLFFKVLAKKPKDRPESLKEKFADVPYLNSSLFSTSKEEQELLYISNLDPNKELSYYNKTILKDVEGKKRKGSTNPLFYLFEFLDAYDFSSEGSEELQSESKTLINAAVLGLIFEKLNGYKDGSFYTPSFITMYMSKQSVERGLIEKFNTTKGWSAKTIDDIYNNIDDKKEANEIVNSLSICDPAVGSGHFLVSVLNHLIYIKHKLGILQDSEGKRLRDIDIELDSDELIIRDEDGELFEYRKGSKEKTRIQKTLFEEKKKLIENSLFGVDINPNSVNICRLRLWIELLKNAYYHEGGNLETLPNIDINIKCGNSLISRYSLTDDIKTKNIKQTINEYKERIRDYKENIGDKLAIQGTIDRLKEQFKLTLKAGYRHRQTLKEKLKLYVSEYGFEGLSKNLTLEAVEFGYLPQAKLIDDDSRQKEKQKATLKKEIELLEAKITEFESGKVYDNAFEWRFEFPEVLDEEGEFRGFDIVIGNPPYIKEYENKSAFDGTRELPCYLGKMDIWYHFACMGLNLLRKNGLLSFIATNNWVSNAGAKKLRNKILNDAQIISLIDFGEYMVFDEASIQTMIMEFANKKRKEYSFDYRRLEILKPTISDAISLLKREVKDGVEILSPNIKIDDFIDTPLKFSSSKIEAVLNKMVAKANFYFKKDEVTNGIHHHHDIVDKKKKEKLGNDFNVGDGIFVVSNKEKQSLNLTTDEENLLKPEYDTKQLHRYYANPKNDKWVIYTTSNFKNPSEMDKYPNLKNHLDRFKEVITSDNRPYGLHRSRNEYFFKGEKIISLRKCSDKPTFTYTDFDCYVSATFYVIKTEKVNMKYLVGLLNSKLIEFWLKHKGKMQGSNYQIDKEPLLSLPLIECKDCYPLIDLVDKILEAKKTSPQADTTELERKIDEMVYALYGLSEEEIAVVEGESK